jgi:intracellular sulfur oxidation DsrE/DsrF family protein
MTHKLCLICSLMLLAVGSHAAEPGLGPVIKNYGPVFDVPAGAFNLKLDGHYKVTMDVSAASKDNVSVNRNLESAARFLNMQARSGMPASSIEFALIVHGPAARDLLTDVAYDERFMVKNPNTELLSELKTAGVTVYLCGQTAAYNDYLADELHPAVTMALSAMTAHVRLQAEGHTLIPF